MRSVVTQTLDKWQTPSLCEAYRTRLIGLLSFFIYVNNICVREYLHTLYIIIYSEKEKEERNKHPPKKHA